MCVEKKNSDNLACVSRANRLAISGWARLRGTTMVHPHRGVIYGAAVKPQGNCTGAAGEPAAWTPQCPSDLPRSGKPPPDLPNGYAQSCIRRWGCRVRGEGRALVWAGSKRIMFVPSRCVGIGHVPFRSLSLRYVLSVLRFMSWGP